MVGPWGVLFPDRRSYRSVLTNMERCGGLGHKHSNGNGYRLEEREESRRPPTNHPGQQPMGRHHEPRLLTMPPAVPSCGLGHNYSITVFPLTMLPAVSTAQNIPAIKMIVVLGELGGRDEYGLVEAMKAGAVTKPVVAWVSGTCATLFKSEVQFGHAGARSGGDAESAQVGGRVCVTWGMGGHGSRGPGGVGWWRRLGRHREGAGGPV